MGWRVRRSAASCECLRRCGGMRGSWSSSPTGASGRRASRLRSTSARMRVPAQTRVRRTSCARARPERFSSCGLRRATASGACWCGWSSGYHPLVKKVDALLADYSSHHRAHGNLVCHSIGIPLIVLGILSFLLLLRLPCALPGWPGAGARVAFASLFYTLLDFPLAVTMLVPMVLLDLAARGIGSGQAGAAAFVVGWVF